MPAAISVPGANGCRRGHQGQRDRAAAAQRGGVRARGLELGPVGQPEEAGDAARAAAEDRPGRRRLVERAERDHAGELRRPPAGGHAAEHATAVRPRADGDVAAEEHGRDQPAAQGAMRVDAAADEPLQVVAPLRVAEEDEAAARADAAEERVERLLDVAVGREVVAVASSSRPGAPGRSPAGTRARTRGRAARSARPGRARSSGPPGRRAWSPAGSAGRRPSGRRRSSRRRGRGRAAAWRRPARASQPR